jgi:hypothetical protein
LNPGEVGSAPHETPPPSSRPWWYERLDAAIPGTAESDEAELGLQGLLAQLPLGELRQIARQRGWRVTCNSKAEMAAALAPLLEDPTEVARAVTALPADLRDALSAVLVAEDGSGIAPVGLAQTMTALRGKSGATLKPVEAAGLMQDLAGWGLLIPWRDAPGRALHYLFPWEMQRHLPPLAGWCHQEAQAPCAPVQASDGMRFVQLLYTVWECLLQQPQRLRSAPEPPPEDRSLAYLNGWSYDPQEVLNRKRTSAASRTLAVPPAPYLLDDAGMAALQPLTDGDPGLLEFACRLLCELDLVGTDKGYLTARFEVMTRFLQSPASEQYVVVALAYISLLDWSELDVLLRADSRLVLRRMTRFVLNYREFRSQLVRLHHMLLRFLATAGEEGWCTLQDVETALRVLWPEFSSAAQTDNGVWPRPAWWLAWREDLRELDARRDPDWHAAQGKFLRAMLEGPLYWLGLAELCRRDGELVAFRLHGLADRVWDRQVATSRELSTDDAIVVDDSQLTLVVHPGAVPPQTHVLLGRIARLEQSAPGRFVYRLDPQVICATFERGETLPDLLAAWNETIPLPVPKAVQEALDAWWSEYGQVRCYDGFSLLELGDDVTPRELEASTSLTQHIVARLSPRLVLVHDDTVDALLQEMTALGLTPKQAA